MAKEAIPTRGAVVPAPSGGASDGARATTKGGPVDRNGARQAPGHAAAAAVDVTP